MARPLPTRLPALLLGVCLSAGLLSACLFETESSLAPAFSTAFPDIHPDLSIGNQWMYRNREFTAFQDGSGGDTATYFIHYEITGDSVIAGIRYRILVEEDLSLFNTDYGLVRNRSAYAVLADSSSLLVKELKGGEQGTGRFPFKTTAGTAFDTAHFMDELTVLRMPLNAGKGWIYREPGNASGSWSASKTFLGWDTLRVSGAPVAALKFQVKVENQDYIRRYEWYADDVKIFSLFSASTTFAGLDSLRSEEAYQGKRYFTKADTLAVLKGTIFDPNP